MSDVVNIRFYYGPGTVQTTEMGADLSEFTNISLLAKNLIQRTLVVARVKKPR